MERAVQEKENIDWGKSRIPAWLRMLIGIVVVLLLLFILCRVNRFEISGNVHYTTEEITNASGITDGDITMGINKTRTAARLLAKLPYIKKVVISKSLPGTISIQVEECTACAAVESEYGSWWLLNKDGKILEEIDSSSDSAYPLLTGTLLTVPNPGDIASYTDSDLAATLFEVLDACEIAGITEEISKISAEDRNNITLEYNERLSIDIGNGKKAEYKLLYFNSILSKLGENASGLVDLTFSDGEQAIYHAYS